VEVGSLGLLTDLQAAADRARGQNSTAQAVWRRRNAKVLGIVRQTGRLLGPKIREGQTCGIEAEGPQPTSRRRKAEAEYTRGRRTDDARAENRQALGARFLRRALKRGPIPKVQAQLYRSRQPRCS